MPCDAWAQTNTFLSSLSLLWSDYFENPWFCVSSWFSLTCSPNSLEHRWLIFHPTSSLGLYPLPKSLGPHLASFFLSFLSQIKCYLLRATSCSYLFLCFYVVIVYRWHFGVFEEKIYIHDMVFLLLNFRDYLSSSKLILGFLRHLSYLLSFPESPFVPTYCIRLHLFLP